MKFRECGHADRIENKLYFKFPVYLKRDQTKAGILIAPQPDYYIERSYCMDCLVRHIDKLMRPPWWRRALDWWQGKREVE